MADQSMFGSDWIRTEHAPEALIAALDRQPRPPSVVDRGCAEQPVDGVVRATMEATRPDRPSFQPEAKTRN
jgi:hypothetical protein